MTKGGMLVKGCLGMHLDPRPNKPQFVRLTEVGRGNVKETHHIHRREPHVPLTIAKGVRLFNPFRKIERKG